MSEVDPSADPEKIKIDEDLKALSRFELIDKFQRLRDGVRTLGKVDDLSLNGELTALLNMLPEVAEPDYPNIVNGCVIKRIPKEVFFGDKS